LGGGFKTGLSGARDSLTALPLFLVSKGGQPEKPVEKEEGVTNSVMVDVLERSTPSLEEQKDSVNNCSSLENEEDLQMPN